MSTKHSVVISLIGLLILTACAAPTTPNPPAATPDIPTPVPTPASAPASIAAAEKLLDQLVQEDYAAILTNFDAAMQAALPEDKLKQAWTGVLAQYGAFQNRANTQFATHVDKYDVVIVMARFEKGGLGLRISVDAATGQIGGLFFTADTGKPMAYNVPAYVDTSKFNEREVTLGTGDWQLPGTLTLPKGDGPFPAVVLVHGSGPNDRDETIGPNKPFKDLAWGLASQGVAVLRYDKRSKVYGQQMAALTTLTVKEEVIDDAVTAVALLRQQPGIDPKRVFVLGHSLGGYLAPRIALAGPDIAGLIILAGATRPLEDLILEQTEYIMSLSESTTHQAPIDQLKEQIALVKALKPGDEAKPAILGAPPAYWLDLQNYRPAELAKSVSKPMLILQGMRDYQVREADFVNWQQALSTRSDVQLKTYPNLNHLFITGDKESTPQEYQTAGSVDQTVIDDIAAWLKQR